MSRHYYDEGMHYKCIKGSKKWGTRKDWLYVMEGDELVHYSKRYQTRLLNGHMLIELPDAFEVCVYTFRGECDCERCQEKHGK